MTDRGSTKPPSASTTWVDGVAGATVPADDRGLQYGDGVFETLLCRDGRPRFLALHLDRLARGCDALGFRAPPVTLLCTEVKQAAQLCGDGIVKLVVTRGSSLQRGYMPPAEPQPRRIVTVHAVDNTGLWNRQGVSVTFSDHVLPVSSRLGGVKHLNRLDNVLARAALAGTPIAEALLSLTDGQVVCGTMSNVFLVRGRRLITPFVGDAGIAGVIRAVVLRESAALGLDAVEGRLRRPDFASADEVFLTNARVGVCPVVALAGWHGTAGVVTRKLQIHIDALQD